MSMKIECPKQHEKEVKRRLALVTKAELITCVLQAVTEGAEDEEYKVAVSLSVEDVFCEVFSDYINEPHLSGGLMEAYGEELKRELIDKGVLTAESGDTGEYVHLTDDGVERPDEWVALIDAREAAHEKDAYNQWFDAMTPREQEITLLEDKILELRKGNKEVINLKISFPDDIKYPLYSGDLGVSHMTFSVDDGERIQQIGHETDGLYLLVEYAVQKLGYPNEFFKLLEHPECVYLVTVDKIKDAREWRNRNITDEHCPLSRKVLAYGSGLELLKRVQQATECLS